MQAVICDLGSSKLQGELTTSSLVLPVSTPQYRAPEVWQGQKLTPLSDVFAFGVLLHQLITQRRPFAGFEPATLAAVITNEGELRNRLAIPADAVPGTIANGLQDLLERCLRQERGVRPSFGQIHEDLKRLQTSYKEGKVRACLAVFKQQVPFMRATTILCCAH